MKINFITCILKNHIRNHLFISDMCRNAKIEYLKNLTRCSCPAAILTCSITSKAASRNRNNTINGSKVLDAQKRFYSSNSGPPSTRIPPLMNFPEIVWPSLIKSIRNFILSTFIIKPYFDREFNLPDFVQGAKKALEVVSSRIAEGDIPSLEGLVTNDVILSLEKSTSYMTVLQRQQIAINSDDVYFSFPYQVGIMFKDEKGKEQKRFVEITMVFHTLQGLQAMRDRGEEPPINMGMMPEYQKRISICNYRFIREFTKGTDSDWTVNLLNHFKPADQVEE